MKRRRSWKKAVLSSSIRRYCLRAQGVKSGVPDLCLPVARGASHGLYIELKRQRGGRISEEQVRWINGLLKQGYAAAICKGWQEAASVITDYLRQKTEG